MVKRKEEGGGRYEKEREKEEGGKRERQERRKGESERIGHKTSGIRKYRTTNEKKIKHKQLEL